MKNVWLRALAVWIGIMSAETVLGTLRTLYLEPGIGSLHARQVGVLAASTVIFGVVWATGRWFGSEDDDGPLLNIGAAWVALTVVFELALGVAFVAEWWERMLADYDVARGGLMPPGLFFMSFAPWLAARLRRRLDGGGHPLSSVRQH